MPIEIKTQNEREQCEAIAKDWMTDVRAHKTLADVIATARAGARQEALAGAAVVADAVARKYRALAASSPDKNDYTFADGAACSAVEVATNIRKVLVP